jgi:hypothetical protein
MLIIVPKKILLSIHQKSSPPSIFNIIIYNTLAAIPEFSWVVV